MKNLTGLRRTVVAATSLAAAAALALTAAVPGQAATSDAGLYGAADPTYDGVFRQSLALLGQVANDVTPPATAITWLLGQQCASGGFQAYRPDTSVPCAAPDPDNYTGPDMNSTAMAVQALMALDNGRVKVRGALLDRVVDAVDKAGGWLAKQQNADGGWPYYSGGASDANSTGLAMSAIDTVGGFDSSKEFGRASRFLGRLSASCADGGGFGYQPGSKPDGLSTSQGTLGLFGILPVYKQPAAAVAAPCANTAKAKGTSYLAANLTATGILDSAYGGPDYTATSFAVLALTEAGKGRASIRKGTAALKSKASEYVTPEAGTNPGAAGMLLMVAEATGSKPTDFGGVNLLSVLRSSLRQ